MVVTGFTAAWRLFRIAPEVQLPFKMIWPISAACNVVAPIPPTSPGILNKEPWCDPLADLGIALSEAEISG